MDDTGVELEARPAGAGLTDAEVAEVRAFDDYEIGFTLRSALDAWLPSGPGEAFRARLAARFVSGELVELWGLTEGVATTLKPEDMQEKMA